MHRLITLEQAKKQLRLPVDQSNEDDVINAKIGSAQRLVIDYISDDTDEDLTAVIAAWTDETVPEDVEAAILLMLTFLYHFRGDDPDGWSRIEHGNLPPDVKMCLYRRRTPVIA